MLESLLFLITCHCFYPADGTTYQWDYIIIGAGPGGLQMGYFLQQAHRNYVILERANISGAFFATYPRHGRLISINKIHTDNKNKEFNMRHDWNSLLSHREDLLFQHYSKKFFPPKEDYVRYLNDFQTKLDINTMYNTDVSNIRKYHNTSTRSHYFTMNDRNGNKYLAKYVIVATGIASPNIPDMEGIHHAEGYENMSLDPKDYEGKTVLILGHGNTAFEVADGMFESTNLIHMLGRSRIKHAWATHYVGDLRAINNGLLDTYQLKSLDGVAEGPLELFRIVKDNDKYRVESLHGDSDNFALRNHYDKIIRCLGFKFDETIFHNTTNINPGTGIKKKYPSVKPSYESDSIAGLFFAGTATHSIDFRESAGGFIHGFRYTVRATFHLLQWQNHQIPWPSSQGHVTDLLNTILKRINEVSGLYQMFGVLCDVVLFHNDRYVYLEEFPVRLVRDLHIYSGHILAPLLVLQFEYGKNFSGPDKDVFRKGRATIYPGEAHRSNFLHPVFYFYKNISTSFENKPNIPLARPDRLHHLVEDFTTSWDTPVTHILPLRRFLEVIVEKDLRQFFSGDCLRLAMTFQYTPETCLAHFLHGRGIME